MRTLALYSLCFVAFASVGWTSLGASVVYASGVNYVPLAPIDVTGSEFTSTTFKPESECKAPDCFPKYLRTIYNVGIALAGLFAVFSIVWGGFTLLFTDSILGHSEGKGKILRALGGLVIVYASYIFMNTINPALGRDLDLALNFPKVTILKDPRSLTIVRASDALEKALADISKNLDETKAAAQALEEQGREFRLAAANPNITPAEKAEFLRKAVAVETQAGATRDYNVTKDDVLKAKANGNVFIANLTLADTTTKVQTELDGVQSAITAIDGALTKHLSIIAAAGNSDLDPTHASMYADWVKELITQANAAKQDMRTNAEVYKNSLSTRQSHIFQTTLYKGMVDKINWGQTW